MRTAPLLLAGVLLLILSTPLRAQSVLDNVVGLSAGRPLTITHLTAQSIGKLALAAGAPMGFEGIEPERGRFVKISATGRKLREVLDEVVAAEPQYEWREDDGVIVLRPRSIWSNRMGFLDNRVGFPITLDEIESADALEAIARLAGVDGPIRTGPGDTKRFSVNLPAGSSFLQVLNGIVRAHGTLAWGMVYTDRADFNLTASLFVGGSGAGIGIRLSGSTLDPKDLAGIPSRQHARSAILDRIVGPSRDRLPLVITALSSYNVDQLAAATGVPMGIQLLPSQSGVAVSPVEVTVTGFPLRDVLTWLTLLDPRYEWRELDGIVVFRPAAAWSDPYDPLFRPVQSLQLESVSASRAIAATFSRLGQNDASGFPDERVISVITDAGSVLDLINALVRSHGEMSWSWNDLDEADQRLTGVRYRLTLTLFVGRGTGWPVP